ncbi:MAG TPA: hypothetical protein VFW07_26625 [Parafilimonas sp.]|nr:hypothetical protein [Parafilimonas sp.]
MILIFKVCNILKNKFLSKENIFIFDLEYNLYSESNLKIKLENIVYFQSGIFLKPDINADIYYLQASHFDEYGRFNPMVMPALQLSNIPQKHLLNSGDVLFAAKGLNNFAVTYKEAIGKAVASSAFVVLRITEEFKDKIHPEYLVWLLNHPNTKGLLYQHLAQSTIVSVSIQNLKTMEINIPDMKTQDLVIRIQNLRNREKELLKQITTLKDTFIQKLLLTASK